MEFNCYLNILIYNLISHLESTYMFYLIGHQSHCYIEEGQDGLPTTQSSLDNVLVCSDHNAGLPSSPPNKPCSSSNTVNSSALTAVKPTEQRFQLSPLLEKDMGKF